MYFDSVVEEKKNEVNVELARLNKSQVGKEVAGFPEVSALSTFQFQTFPPGPSVSASL